MAEDDIYGNKKKYEFFKDNLKSFLKVPAEKNAKRKYYCKNPANLKYFKKLFTNFEAKDLSYIRRNRMLQSMRFICHAITEDLASCDREEID